MSNKPDQSTQDYQEFSLRELFPSKREIILGGLAAVAAGTYAIGEYRSASEAESPTACTYTFEDGDTFTEIIDQYILPEATPREQTNAIESISSRSGINDPNNIAADRSVIQLTEIQCEVAKNNGLVVTRTQ